MSFSIGRCLTCMSDATKRCPTHPLVWGCTKQMMLSAVYGYTETWGTEAENYEAQRQAAMTAGEKAALAAKKAAAEKAMEEKMAADKAAADAEKTSQRLRDYANGGISKSKGARRCKGECYEGGCDVRKMHSNACSFIHEDELQTYTGIFACFGIKMVDDAEFLALVRLCDKTEDSLKRSQMKREIKMLDEQIKMQMKGRWLWVTGVDEKGGMKFSRSNPELAQQQQQQQQPLLPLLRNPRQMPMQQMQMQMQQAAFKPREARCAW